MRRSVIIWKDFKKVIKIEGHKQAVWAVKFIGEDRLLTGKLLSTYGGQANMQHRQTRRSYYINLILPRESQNRSGHIQVTQNQ
jgi:hypothetical protein